MTFCYSAKMAEIFSSVKFQRLLKVLQFTFLTFFFVLILFRYPRIFSAISESIEHDYRHTIKSPEAEGTISILMLRVYESC